MKGEKLPAECLGNECTERLRLRKVSWSLSAGFAECLGSECTERLRLRLMNLES